MPPKKQPSNKIQAVPSGGGGSKKSKKLLPGKTPTGKVGQELPSITTPAGSSLSPGPKETGNSKSPRGSVTNIAQASTPTPSPSPSLIKKKKTQQGKPAEDVSGGATGGPGEKVPGISKKNSPPPADASDNPLRSPTGSYKQKLFNKLLKNKPVPVHDEENQDAGAKDGAAGDDGPPNYCNKKIWTILAVILLILLNVGVIMIFALPQGTKGQGSGSGNNDRTSMLTTPMMTSTTTTPSTTSIKPTTTTTTAGPTGNPSCPNLHFPGIDDPVKVGEYCKDCYNNGASCYTCCGTYYEFGKPMVNECIKACGSP